MVAWVSRTNCSFLHYCGRIARRMGFCTCTVDSAKPASRSHMSQGTFASAAMRSERNASAKKSGPLTPPCPNHPRWRRGVLPKQEARGSRRPHRCRGRARGQGRTGRTQRRSQLKAGWPVDRDKTLSHFCPAWKSKNFVSRARNTPLRSVFLSAWEAKVSWSCPARPASLGFPERSGVLPAPEIPGSVSKPKGTPRKYQSGPSSWAATASGEGWGFLGLLSGRGWDYRCVVRGGDTNLLPVAG